MPENVWAPEDGAWESAVGLVDWDEAPATPWAASGERGHWFPGGRLNASVSCVDRHARESGDRVAIHWEGEPGDRRDVTYAELLAEVTTLARALRGLGVEPGDVVALHLGWLPETVVAMLACARIGAVHAIVPTPLPAEALADRLVDLGARVLFTQDGAWRRGTVLPLKVRADEALTAVADIEHTVVVRRTGIDVAWYEGDRWYHDLLVADRRAKRGGGRSGGRSGGEPAVLPADHPLLRINLANRGGRPVVVTHAAGSTLVAAAAIHEWGVGEGGTLWCAGDVSWLGTQAHGIYGPLSRGCSAVMYEGTLDVPTHARAWEIMRRYAVTTFLTTPSVLRSMRGWAPELGAAEAPDSLRRVVTFGESAEPDLRDWAAHELGGGRVTVADGWGQVELCGIVHLDQPLSDRLPGVGPVIERPDGTPAEAGEPGELVLTRAWAGEMLRGDEAVVAATDHHWTTRPGRYTTGDRARLGADGAIEYLGRTDEVVSLSGQLVSLGEVRDLLLDHPFVERADVFERRDHQGGRHLAAAVVLSAHGGAGAEADAVARDLADTVREALGGLARPRVLLLVDRFGDELRGDERRRALAHLPLLDTPEPKHVTWAQVLTVAEHLVETGPRR